MCAHYPVYQITAKHCSSRCTLALLIKLYEIVLPVPSVLESMGESIGYSFHAPTNCSTLQCIETLTVTSFPR